MRPAVIDASVAVKWLLPEPGRAEAVALLDARDAGSRELIAPPLIMIEVANALSKRSRQRLLDSDKAELLFSAFEMKAPQLVETPNHLRLALLLSVRRQISLFDSMYLALALEHGVELITADARFYRSIRLHYPQTTLIA